LRALFLILLLANLAFFAWAAGYFGAGQDGREPERLASQVQADRLQISVAGEPAPPSVMECRHIEPVTAAVADQLRSEWEARGVTVSVQSIDESVFLVMIGGLDKAALERKTAELHRLGVRDTYAFPDREPGEWVLSLGSFRDEASARTHLTRLGQRGVRSARVESRNKASGKLKVELTAPPERLTGLPPGPLAAADAEVTACGGK
jgi:hypothetical protein